MCINCQGLIQSDNVLMHSLICVHPTSTSLEIDSQPIISQFLYKIRKLKQAMETRALSSAAEIEKELYEFLRKISDELLSIDSETLESLEILKGLIFTLEKYSTAQLSPGVLLYNERLRLIAQEWANEVSEKI